MQLLERISGAALDLLYPPQCALCGAGGVLLCDACAAALPAADGPRCDVCWMPVARPDACRHCAAAAPAFASLRSAFVMEGGARRLAHELKYEGLTSLAAPMAALMLRSVGEPLEADVVVPVPLHASRRRSRGYNQAEHLARHVARSLALPLDSRAVRRVRNTQPLAKTMRRTQRIAIMSGAFEAAPERVAGRRVLLIDDVATTGATLDSCASALGDAGAREVRCLVWARAD